MHAERLLSLALLLQARGRMTARRLADHLEVSVRTIYRDIDALSAAGIPVYADRGPGGGFCLLDNYRTELTGLTKAKMRALFMLSIPGALTQLGVDRALKGALLKLTAALPLERLDDERWVREHVLLDWSTWSQPPEPLPNLHTVRRAV